MAFIFAFRIVAYSGPFTKEPRYFPEMHQQRSHEALLHNSGYHTNCFLLIPQQNVLQSIQDGSVKVCSLLSHLGIPVDFHESPGFFYL